MRGTVAKVLRGHAGGRSNLDRPLYQKLKKEYKRERRQGAKAK